MRKPLRESGDEIMAALKNVGLEIAALLEPAVKWLACLCYKIKAWNEAKR